MYYVLGRALGERKPVCWCEDPEDAYLFYDAKVARFPVKDVSSRFLPGRPDRPLLCLVDSNNSFNQTDLPALFTKQGNASVFTVLATSPKAQRWKGFQKYRNAQVYTMSLWTEDEIIQAAS